MTIASQTLADIDNLPEGEDFTKAAWNLINERINQDDNGECVVDDTAIPTDEFSAIFPDGSALTMPDGSDCAAWDFWGEMPDAPTLPEIIEYEFGDCTRYAIHVPHQASPTVVDMDEWRKHAEDEDIIRDLRDQSRVVWAGETIDEVRLAALEYRGHQEQAVRRAAREWLPTLDVWINASSDAEVADVPLDADALFDAWREELEGPVADKLGVNIEGHEVIVTVSVAPGVDPWGDQNDDGSLASRAYYDAYDRLDLSQIERAK